jgi:hypothetical protein
MPQKPLGLGGWWTENSPQWPGGKPAGHLEHTLDAKLEGLHSQQPRGHFLAIDSVRSWWLRGIHSWQLRGIHSWKLRGIHSWQLGVYTLKLGVKSVLSMARRIPSRPLGAVFGLPTPQTRWILGHWLRPPWRVYFFELLGIWLPKTLMGLGDQLPIIREFEGFGGLGVN